MASSLPPAVRSAREAVFPIGASATLDELDRDPHPLLARLRVDEPVSWLPVLNAWMVTPRELALQVLRDATTFTVDDPRFSTGQVVGQSMLTRDGAEHGRHRDPFARPFRLAPVQERFSEFVGAETDRLIDAFVQSPRAELRRSLAGPLAVAVVASALGLEGADVASVLGWYDAIVDAVTRVTAGDAVSERGTEAFAALRSTIEPMLTHDSSQSLLAAAAGDAAGLTRAEVVSNAAVLMFGGIETTEGMIANALLHLLSRSGRARARSTAIRSCSRTRSRSRCAWSPPLRWSTAMQRVTSHSRAPRSVSASSSRCRSPAQIAIPPRSPIPTASTSLATTRGSTWRSRRGRMSASGCTSHDSKHTQRSGGSSSAARVSGSTRPSPSAPRGLVFRKPPALHVLLD